MQKLLTLFIFLIALQGPGPAWAMGEVEFVRQAYQTLSERSQPVTGADVEKAMALFDFGALFAEITQDFSAQVKVGDYQLLQETFLKLFSKNISEKGLKLSSKKVGGIRFLDKGAVGNKKTIEVGGIYGEKKVTVLFFIRRFQGQPRIVDISIEGALLSRNYRGAFNRIFRKEGVSGLMTRIQRKINWVGP